MKQRRLVNPTMFDLLKGVGILLVVLLHSIQWEAQNQFGWKIIYSILMPVFFVTSGYWMKKKKLKDGLITSAVFVLKPYLITVFIIEFIGLVHRLLTNDLTDWLETFLMPGILGMSGENSRFGPLWFLLALFWAWCLFYVAMLIRQEWIQILCAVLCGIAGGALLPCKLPFQISQGLIAFAFVYVGYWVKRKKIFEKKFPVITVAGMLALWAFTVWFGSMDLGMYSVKLGFVSVAGSAAGALLVIRIFLHINQFENSLFDVLEQTGRYTMWILCVHAAEGAVVPWNVLWKYVPYGTWTGTVCWFCVRWILIAVICVGLSKIQRILVRRKEQRAK